MARPAWPEELWRSTEDVYAAILEHPFLRGLADGTLDREAFRAFVVQDAHYLVGFARALAVLAGRAPGPDDVVLLSGHATGALVDERALHEGLLPELGLAEADVRATPLAPTCLAYTSYLLAAVHDGSFAEGLAAVLPCYRIYWEVGRHLVAAGSPDPLYQRWIDTYADETYADVVRSVLALAERVGAELGPAERAAAGERFRTTARYEWMFWEMGLRRERWPI